MGGGLLRLKKDVLFGEVVVCKIYFYVEGGVMLQLHELLDLNNISLFLSFSFLLILFFVLLSTVIKTSLPFSIVENHSLSLFLCHRRNGE